MTRRHTGAESIDVTHEQMVGGVPSDPSLKETAIYTGAHLARIRDMYVAGEPIALPPQITGAEREELERLRAEYLAKATGATSQGSTGSAAPVSLSGTNSTRTSPRSTNDVARSSAGSTAAPSTATQSAGTAGSPSGTAGAE